MKKDTRGGTELKMIIMMRMKMVIRLTLPNWQRTFPSEADLRSMRQVTRRNVSQQCPFLSLQWKCDKIQFGASSHLLTVVVLYFSTPSPFIYYDDNKSSKKRRFWNIFLLFPRHSSIGDLVHQTFFRFLHLRSHLSLRQFLLIFVRENVFS